jgi:hypothetical protein
MVVTAGVGTGSLMAVTVVKAVEVEVEVVDTTTGVSDATGRTVRVDLTVGAAVVGSTSTR